MNNFRFIDDFIAINYRDEYQSFKEVYLAKLKLKKVNYVSTER